jgi:hypothetical protein
MKNTRIDNLGARRSVGEAPNPETALFLAATAFGLAMLSLLAVLALADIVGPAHILPFFAFPLMLFIASASLIRRWVKAEADGGSHQGQPPIAHRSDRLRSWRPPRQMDSTRGDLRSNKQRRPDDGWSSGQAANNHPEAPAPQKRPPAQRGELMKLVAIVARLKEGSGPRAAQLIAGGPPFDLAEIGLASHSVYLSAGEVVFVFEGDQVEWTVDELIDNPFRPEIQSAFDQWREIIDGSPRIAREQFGWHADGSEPAAEAMAGSARWA